MKRLLAQFGAALFFAAALSFAVIPAVEAAAVTPNNVKNSSGGAATVVPVLQVDQSGNYVAAGGGGGGGGDASAANQTSQITQETAINTVLGVKGDAKSTATDTTAVSAMSVLKQISASVQAPPSQAVTNAGTFAVQAAGVPASIGQKTAANSMSVVLSSDGPFASNFGLTTDAKSTATDATAATAMSVWKQISASVQAPPSQAVTNAGTFAVQSVGEPTSLGQKTAANSMSVVLSSDGPFAANFGITTDAKSTATDATAASAMSVWKQISASVQAPPSQAVTNAGTFAVQSTASAGTTGGCTLGKTLSAATTNATSVKGSAGTLCSLTVINTTANLYYLKFYDKASAATCNSDTVIQSIPIPASTTGAGVAVAIGPYGWAFPTGITFCLTGALADNDNTAAATGVAINYSYK